MKNVFKVTALALALGFVANTANAQDKIGYINPNVLLQSHPLLSHPESEFVKKVKAEEAILAAEEQKLAEEDKALQAEEKKLSDDAKKLSAEEKNVDASIKKKVAALEKEAPRLRSADIKKRQDAITAEGKAFQNKVNAIQKRESDLRTKIGAFQAKVSEFQSKASESQRKIADEQAKIQQVVMTDVRSSIAELAKAKGFSLVIDTAAVMYTTNDSHDFTQDVIKALSTKPFTMPNTSAPAESQSTETAPKAK